MGPLLLMAVLALFTGQTLSQEMCVTNQCQNGENCYNRPVDAISPEGYICECNLPFRDGYNCAIGPDNQEVYTCFGSSCLTGTFTSKDWPNEYPSRYRALYLLYIPGANGIKFTFNAPFSIEMDKDELYIGKGLTVDFNQLLGTDTVGPDVLFFEGDQLPGEAVLDNTDVAYLYFITDKNIQFAGFSVSFQMVDIDPPAIINCPSDISLTTEVPEGTQAVWTAPTATDASAFTTTSTHVPGQLFPQGPTTVTYVFRDALGNEATCSFTVTVTLIDEQPPQIQTTTDDITVTVPFGTTGTSVNWNEPTATDNLGTVFTSRSNDPGSFFLTGTSTLVTYTFADTFGNTVSTSFTVQVVEEADAIPPVVTSFPSDITITVPFGTTSAVVNWDEPSSTDNSGTSTASSNLPSGSTFPVGTTPVTYTFTDPAGNTATQTFTVNIIMLPDTEPPNVLTFPEDITLTVPFGTTSTVVNWTPPTANDNSGTVNTVSDVQPGSSFPPGETQVTYTFTDPAGNTVNRVLNVNVVVLSDTTPPVVTSFPTDVTVTVPFGTDSIPVTWDEPTSTDNSGTSTQSTNIPSGSTFPVGTTPVTYTFVDPAGNSVTRTFDVTIIMQPDSEPPSVQTFPNDITVTIPFGTPNSVVNWPVPTVTDNSGTVSVSTNQEPGTSFPIGSTPVTYTFTDPAGNTVTRTFTVNVVELPDSTPPSVNSFPGDITITVPFGTTETPVSWNEPTSTDNSGTSTQSSNIPSGSTFPLGSTPVTYTFTDPTGNSVTRTFTVNVIMLADNEPPSVQTFPEDITVTVPFGTSNSLVNWPVPTATDNSGTVNVNTNREPGGSFPVGSTPVTYTFTDPAGNTVTRTFTVNVVELPDSNPPTVVSFPEDITVTVPFGTTQTPVSWNEPTSTDDSGTSTQSFNIPSGSSFPVGSTPVTYTFTDPTGNSVTRTFTVNVIMLADTEPPSVQTFPRDVTITVPFGTTSSVVNWPVPTVTDNSGTVSVNSNREPGQTFPVGTTPVTYTFTDPTGNTVTRTFSVNVVELPDSNPPTVTSFPNDITVTVPFGTRETPVSWNEPTSTDNSGTSTQSSNIPSGSNFPVGSTAVTYTFTDPTGNTVTQTFNVNVIELADTEPPAVESFPDDITVTVPFGTTSSVVNWPAPTVTDNSGSVSVNSNRAPGSSFSLGTTPVTYTFTDPAGNTVTRTFNVNVMELADNVPPVVTSFPQDITVTVPFGTTETPVTWDEPTSTDNSGSSFQNPSKLPGSSFPVGSTPVTYTFTDPSGNTVTQTFTVNVIELGDTSPPVVQTFPNDITVTVPFGTTSTIVNWPVPTSSDNSGTVSTNSNREPGSSFPIGTTPVTYTFTDPTGNTVTRTFNVNVMALPDTTPPVVNTFPQDVTVTVPFGTTGTVVNWDEPTSTDNSGTSTQSTDIPSGSSFPVGSTPVTYTFTDPDGNSVTRTFTVNVIELADTEAPVVQNFPNDITVTVPFGSDSTIVNWPEPTVTDNSGTVNSNSNRQPGSVFQPGTTAVIYTFTDPSGNTVTRTFNVNVRVASDNSPPVVTSFPDDITVTVPFGTMEATVTWDEPTSTDNSGSSSQNPSRPSGSTFPVGSTPVTYTFTDPSGNTVTQTFTVNVIELPDNEPPSVISFPSDITVTVPFGVSRTPVNWSPPVSTDNSGTVSVSSNREPGSSFQPGTTTVVYTFTDPAGNTITRDFDVNVIVQPDTTPPVVTTFPADVSVTVPFGIDSATVTWEEPTSTDNSGTATQVASIQSGSSFPLGTTPVTYTFTDPSGNTVEQTFNVRVIQLPDDIRPVVTSFPSDITITVPFGTTSAVATWDEPTSTDNSGTSNQSGSIPSGSTFPLGITPVTYTFTDPSGNTVTMTFNVNVVMESDNEPPVVDSFPNDVTVTVPFGTSSTPISWPTPTATDNSGTVSINSNRDPGSSFTPGSTQVTYTFTDPSGNTVTRSFNVNVVVLPDGVPPVITSFPADVTVTVPFGTTGTTVTWDEPTSVDNSGFSFQNPSKTPGSFFPVGTTPVTYTFMDPTGNGVEMTFNVNVVELPDTEPPVIATFPEDIVRTVPFGTLSTPVSWQPPTYTDNSGTTEIATNIQPGSSFLPGTTPVTYTFTDPSGNSVIRSFNVVVVVLPDTDPPVVLTFPSDITVTVPFGTGSTPVTWDDPTSTDNSGSSFQNPSITPGSAFPVGTTPVTYTFNDPSGNTVTQTFEVTVIELPDTEPPSVETFPSDITVTVPFGTPSTLVNWPFPTATDNSGTVNTFTSNEPGSSFPVGQTTVTYTFTDPSGNTVARSFDINVITQPDSVPPSVTSFPDDITVTVPFGATGTVVTWDEPTSTDNSGVSIQNPSKLPGSTFLVGSTPVTYTFTDPSGNMVERTFTVNVVELPDTEPPVVTSFPSDITVTVPFGTESTPITWVPPSSTDNSGTVETNSNREPGSSFPPGTTPVTYTFTDPAGNTVARTFNVNVNVLPDTQVPTILTFPSDTTITVPFGIDSAVVTWDEPTSSDNSGGTFQTPSKPSGSEFPLGSTPVTYTFTDPAGNEVSRTFTVNVVQLPDSTPPVVTSFPSDVTITVPFGTTGTPVTWNEPTSTDNSGTSSQSGSIPSGSVFPVGSTPVTYTFTDPAGNSVTQSFMVNVIMLPDTEPPQIVEFPDDITITVPFGTDEVPINWPVPAVSDNSGTVNSNSNKQPGSNFQPGTTPVTYTFTDPAGNTVTRTFNVNVVVEPDTSAPEINTFPSDITVMVPFGSTGTTVDWDEPTTTDNSGTSIPSSNLPSGSFFPVGSTPVTYTFTDPSGNTRTETFNVNVVMMPDTEAPVVQEFPEDITVTVPFGSDNTPVTWPQPTVTDNSGTVNSITNKQPGSLFQPGTTPVMYTFTDPSGNVVMRTFNVNVMVLSDNSPPVVTRFPSDITLTVPFGTDETPVNWQEPTSTDNSGSSFQTPSLPSGSTFPVGMTPVTYTFTDPSGNTVERTFTVNVVRLPDNVLPLIVDSPEDIEVFVPFGSTGTNVNWSPPTATDNSGTVIPSASQEPGSFFPLGNTPVTYTFTDPAGNIATTSFMVKVTELPDTIPPMITSLSEDVTVTVPFGSPGTTVSWPEPTATDNSGSFTTTKTDEPGSFFPTGSVTPVTYTFTDPAGNTVSTTLTVRVVEEPDEVSPVFITCQSDITFHVLTGKAPVPVQFTAPTASDNSGSVNLVIRTKNPGDMFNAGRTAVEYKFEDQAGNSASCTFNVDVVEANPCSPEPCQNGAACVPATLTTYTCICPDCYLGDTCEIAMDACENNACLNGAACAALAGSCTQYECQCPACYTGQFCQTFVDSCENNQCANGAQCVTSPDDCLEYTCRCPPCFTGRYCDIPVDACDNHGCLSGGMCVPSSLTTSLYSCSQYTCSCTGCFTGARCEIQRDACNPNPCLNGGACSSLPDSCYSYTCQCNGCFTGFNCEIPIPSPCDNNPCQNGGVCSEVQGACGAYTCACPNSFIGLNCETPISENPNPCNSFPCKNGASCLTMDSDHYMCLCTGDYVGPNCQTQRGNAPQLDACGSFPCINGAACYNSFNSNSGTNTFIPQYSCICADGFTGTNCDTATGDAPALNICSLGERPPCQQGAQCSNAYHSLDQDVDYYCACPVGFIGHNCETPISDPCASNPCRNGANCIAFNTYFMCECLPGFGAKTCETRDGDTTPPSISNCPASVYLGNSGLSGQTVSWTPPTATDDSGTVVQVYASHQPDSVFPRGVTPVTYIFADPSQNYARCVFFINIEDGSPVADNVPPTINNCPNDISVTATSGANIAVVTWTEPTATDNAPGTVTLQSPTGSGSSFNLGSTVVTYTATDASGNQATCSFTVTVNAPEDNTPPTIIGCPTGATATASVGASSAPVTWTAPTATDNSGGQVTISASAQPGDSFPVGATTVLYTFTDPSGNEATCSFMVVVNAVEGPDREAPVISGCPGDQSVSPDPGSDFATVTWVEPTAVDNSGQEPGEAKSHQPPATFPRDTITRVSYVFFDNSGNFNTCAFTVTVSGNGNGGTTDTTDPVFTNCPDNIVSYVNGPGSTASVEWSVPTATDNSGVPPTVTGSLAPPVNLGVGSTTASYTATDAAGNQATCTFSVSIILDTEAPTITNCPSDITEVLPAGSSSVSVPWSEPSASDNSGSVSVTRSDNPNSFFAAGINVITYTFTDPAGNEAICSFTITVTSDQRNRRDVSQDDCMCLNGGVCIPDGWSYSCACPSNFTGVLCEKKRASMGSDSTKPLTPMELEMHQDRDGSFETWLMGAVMVLLGFVIVILAVTVSRLAPRTAAARTDAIDKANLVY
ncbi:mucin-2-like isoform X2 [Acanthaster planci]|uniref:Mucin-2-like isoform X2 n=1 Tax=Acanthaster planci TaxID=133434 RepID=A0A8B7XQ49_ACAPL|nr:mucin-2-like isoform X2 [Acanthaster planci]